MRVGLFYWVLPKYRLAIYEALAKRPEIDLTVLYSKEPPWYSSKIIDPQGRFKSEVIELRAWRLAKQEVLYQPDASRIISSGRFDVIILPGNPRLLSNLPSLYTAKRRGVGVVWWSLGLMPDQSPVTFVLKKGLMRIPEALLFYSERPANPSLHRGCPAILCFP